MAGGTVRSFVGDVRRRLRHRRWRLPEARPLGAFDASAGEYPAYAWLQRALAQNRAGPQLRGAYERLGADEPALARVESHLGDLDGDRRAAVLGLYAEAMRLPAREGVLLGYLQRHVPARLDHIDRDPASRGNAYAWPVSHFLDAALTGVERTGSRRLLELTASALDHILERRDDVAGRIDEVRGRVLRCWGGDGFVPGRHSVNITAAGRINHHFARFAAAAGGVPEHAERAERFANAAAESLEEFDQEYRVERDGAGWYPVPGGTRPEAINHLAAMGSALLALHDVTGDDGALGRASGLARFVRSAWYRERDGAIVWDYAPDVETRRGGGTEFVWKAQVTMGFVHMAAQRSVVFGLEDLTAACATFDAHVFRSRGVNATIYRRHRPLEPFGDHRGGYQSLLPLRAFGGPCPAVAGAVEELVATRPAVGGWLFRPQGAVGYAARLGS